MYDLDAYQDTVPDLAGLLQFTPPDEADTAAELARLDERTSVYRTLRELNMLGYAPRIA